LAELGRPWQTLAFWNLEHFSTWKTLANLGKFGLRKFWLEMQDLEKFVRLHVCQKFLSRRK
jgi:hypothetical protein